MNTVIHESQLEEYLETAVAVSPNEDTSGESISVDVYAVIGYDCEEWIAVRYANTNVFYLAERILM